MTIFAILTVVGAAVSAFLFRRGGIYNPVLPSLDNLTTVPDPDLIPASPVIIAPDAPKLAQDESLMSEPATLSTSSQEANKATLDNLCLAIRDFEGLQINANGKPDRNWKNNNPGNCRYSSVGYLPKYLPVLKDKDGFAIFKDYATGWNYLQNMLKAQIHLHPNWTILDMMTNYAPESDNNPTLNYAKHVAKRMGVDIRFKVKNIVV